MPHHPDLSVITDPTSGAELIAVGWLERGHAYARGPVERSFVLELALLLQDPWQPAISPGHHPCDLCRFTGGPGSVVFGDVHVAIGSACVYVPAPEGVYCAPATVLHYLDAHEYAPPRAFIDAVARCPEMRSRDYLAAIAKHGLARRRSPGSTGSSR